MILLLGGTSETADVATRLAELGYMVLVSTATDAEQTTGDHPNVSRRTGRLDGEAMAALIRELGVRAIVDVTHPYAVEAHAAAQKAAKLAGIPCLSFVRPSTALRDRKITIAENHQHAAALAFAEGRPVLLTTGSRNLDVYVRESRRTGVKLVARVLDHPESIQACRNAGMQDDCIILGRGPFSVEDNRATIRNYCIGTLVTKDSGAAGGVNAKLEAAELESCSIVIIQRPDLASNASNTITELVDCVLRGVPTDLEESSRKPML
ncbi:MAG: precorrin-6A reductase [Armatimonadota bacterium]